MNYPGGFFTRMFAWGRSLELSRRLAIYICALLFLISAIGGAIFWANRSTSVRPYFIHIGRYMDRTDWTVFSAHRAESSAVPWFRLMQESIAVNYATNFLRISNDESENREMLWCRCNAAQCDADPGECQICCAASSSQFDAFLQNTWPVWQEMFDRGEFMEFTDVHAVPAGIITETGGLWRVTGTVATTRGFNRSVTAFVRIERVGRGNAHARTLGFFVSEFDFFAGI